MKISDNPNQSINLPLQPLWKILSNKQKSILIGILLTGSIGSGVMIKNKIDRNNQQQHWEEVMNEISSITQGDIAIMKKIFPAGRQTSEVIPALEKLIKDKVISRIETAQDIPSNFINMEKLHADKFVFSNVNHPQVHPQFAYLLIHIVDRFNEKLQGLGYRGGYVKPTITSLTRPATSNKNLSNASRYSSHQYGIAADIRIIGDRFKTHDIQGDNTYQEDKFMSIFIETLQEFQSQGDILVMTEQNPPHFHINMMKSIQPIDKTVEKKIIIEKKLSNQVDEEKGNFSKYLESIRLQPYDKNTEFGKYIRSMRRYKSIKKIIDESKSSMTIDYIIAGLMQESLGDPTSIAELDGGAGIIHFQSNVAEFEYHMNIFTRHDEYKHLAIRGRKNNESDKDYRQYLSSMYKKHGKELVNILKKHNYNLSELEKIDDRFHTEKCLKAGVKYLNNNYNFAKNFDFHANNKDKQHANNILYAKENGLDIWQLYALNGYNKGRGSFLKDFGGSSSLGGNHITHIVRHLKYLKIYNKYLEDGIKKGLKDEDLLHYIQQQSLQELGHKKSNTNNKKNNTDNKKNITDSKKSKYNPVEYIKESQDKKYKIYKYIVKSGGNVGGVMNAVSHNLNIQKSSIQVVDVYGNIYPKNKKFARGEKVYIKIAK